MPIRNCVWESQPRQKCSDSIARRKQTAEAFFSCVARAGDGQLWAIAARNAPQRGNQGTQALVFVEPPARWKPVCDPHYVEKNWSLGSLGTDDALADDLSDMFNYSETPIQPLASDKRFKSLMSRYSRMLNTFTAIIR